MDALHFESGWILWLLPAPLLLAWWSSRAVGARSQPTGAIALWREVARDAPRLARRTWRWPPHVVAAVAGLMFGLLALARPQWARATAPVQWRVVVDVSASMQLPVAEAAPTRLERALELARTWLATRTRDGDRVEWIVAAGDSVLARLDSPPLQWADVEVARRSYDRPHWSLFDAPQTLWATDVARELAPSEAGVCASGGDVAPGVLASWPDGALVWDGASTTTRAPLRRPRVALAAAARGTDIGRIVGAWAQARGVELVEASESVELTVTLSGDPATESSVAPSVGSRDGWRIEGAATELPGDAPDAAAWLVDQQAPERVLVRARRGRVDCAWTVDHHARGDDAAFAVSWSELLDALLLPCEPTATIEQRASAGAPVLRNPPRDEDSRRGDESFASALALLAASCAAAAAWLRR